MAENGSRPASKSDLDGVRTELKSDLDGVRIELKSDLDGVRAELKSDIHGVRAELKADIRRLDGKIDRVAAGLVDTRTEMRRSHDRLVGLIRAESSKTQKMLVEHFSEFRKLDRRQVITAHNVKKLEQRVSRLANGRGNGSGGASQVRHNGRRYRAVKPPRR